MSTNINILDAALLEKIANELFLGESTASNSTQQPATYNNYLGEDNQQDGTSRNGESFTPSVAGSGISPSAINQRNAVDLQNPQTSLQDPNVPGNDIPNSTAGSGVSPSSYSSANSFSLQEPQRNFSDYSYRDNPNDALISKNYADYATSKGDQFGQYQKDQPLDSTHLSFQEISPFQEELNQALSQVHSYIPTGQLPIDHSAYFSQGSQYYFDPYFSKTSSTFLNTGFQDFGNITKPPFDLNLIRNDFPILAEIVNGKKLIWLDNAATTQKPNQVISRLSYYYQHENSNIHRAAHTLAARATDAYEDAREIVRNFINARSTKEIVFVRGTTEAINLVAQTWGDQYLKEGDEIIVSHLEHHANIVPWQLLAKKKGLKLKVIPVDDNGELLLEEYQKLLTTKTKLISVTAVSNALGTVNPIRKIVEIGHQIGAKVLIDGAQSVSHIPTDVQSLDADWFVFSGHKIYGPTGIGVVYGKEDLLNASQPWQGGGNMIKDVTFEHTEFNPAPTLFEAGTGNIGDAVGLGAALKYVNKIGIGLIHQYESALLQYASVRLKEISGLRIIGNAKEKAGAISFVLDGFETPKIGGLLSKEGIAVRAGHHCAQPILRRFGVEATVRPSFAFYNTCGEIDALVDAVKRIKTGQLV